MLLNIFPCVQLHNITDALRAASKHLTKLAIRHLARLVETSNCANGIGVEVSLNASLPDAVSRIVRRSANEKMGGITARRIVAGMASESIVREVHSGQDQSHAICSRNLPACLCTDGEKPVAILAATGPRPTSIRATTAIYIRPEPIRNAVDGSLMLAHQRAVFYFASLARTNVEWIATLLARGIWGTIVSHLGVPPTQAFWGVAPRAVAAAPRLLHAPIIPQFQGVRPVED